MFTVCPKCTLTLVVTTVDLRAGQGYVRCGRCANVFNALIALREGELAGTSARSPIEPALGSGVAMEPEPEPQPEVAAEEASLEFNGASTDVSDIFVPPPETEHDISSGSYEAVVLAEEPQPDAEIASAAETEAPTFSPADTIVADEWSLLEDSPADDESVIEESPFAQRAAAAPEPNAPDPPWVEEMFAEAEADAKRVHTAGHDARELAGTDDEPEILQVARASTGAAAPSDIAFEPLLTPPVKGRPRWQYAAGVVLLAFVLLLQILHQNRHDLALNPTLGPAAATLYGWLGVTLVPRWDLTAYSVKQLGAEAAGSEGTQLRVRLSVQNESARVQPLPLLRLTLQDLYGNAVATRDLEPADYLPKRLARQRLLEPDQRVDAELHVIDPGKAAIGFEIDACLRGENGAIGCANEARRRDAG